jgi:hypothetical protein
MTKTVLLIPQIADDETLESMDAVLSTFEGSVEVRGNVDDKPGMTFRVAGYRVGALKPLVRPHDPDRPSDDFHRTHYSSMAFLFERLDEAQAFEQQFG